MAYKRGLLLEIQTLYAEHCYTIRHYFGKSMNYKIFRDARICPAEAIKFNTLCRDELRSFLYDCGIDMRHISNGTAPNFCQNGGRMKAVLDQSTTNDKDLLACYSKLMDRYYMILDMNPLPVLVESVLLRQVAALQYLLNEFEMEHSLNELLGNEMSWPESISALG